VEPEELAAAIKQLSEWAREHAPQPEPELRRRLREHLGADPAQLVVVTAELSRYDHVNFQVALDAFVAQEQPQLELIGLPLDRGFRAGLSEIAQKGAMFGMALEGGPMEYVGVDVGDREVSCIKAGLVLLRAGDGPLVALLAPPDHGEGKGLRLEVMAPERAAGDAWLARIRRLMDEGNVYRGKVLAFGSNHPFHGAPLSVRTLPAVRRDQIVLPDGTLERLERHTAGLSKHRDALVAQGRHVKRGLLLHGPPGTGKTLSVMYLAGLMEKRTTLLLTGEAMHLVGPGVQLARELEPSMVVIEDVDLVAQERSHYTANPILFELLNAMEGLDEDADIIFVLTTNRAELLEPALASRPGRIDLAVELPLPDAAGRERLLELYGIGLDHTVEDWSAIVEATHETSPAFIRELMRRAALSAAEAGARVTKAHLLAAVEELRHQGGRLTATLVGAERPREEAPAVPAAEPAVYDEEL
jgi:hypothetical protein